jgi:integrase
MTTRRSRGEGGLHWDEARERWIGTVSVGFDARGKRRRRRFSAKTKTEAKERLKSLLRAVEEGIDISGSRVTVGEVVDGWLVYGLNGRSAATVTTCRHLAKTHIVPALGARKVVDLRAQDVDRFLLGLRATLSTATLQRLLSILRRALRWAQARDLVSRNVALLCTAPVGTEGRPSRSLTFEQAQRLLSASESGPLAGYIVLALLTGMRTEELRALTWDHLDLAGNLDASPPRPPNVQVWKSVRVGGDTKTRRSRRTIALPIRCVVALEKHRADQQAADLWSENGYVFCTGRGTPLDAANLRRSFRVVVAAAGLDPTAWTPRELRHSFVSLLSDAGVAVEDIARLVGHRSTTVTETVYRKQLRPVLTGGSQVMDMLFLAADMEV